jgi:CHAT domain-containing protein
MKTVRYTIVCFLFFICFVRSHAQPVNVCDISTSRRAINSIEQRVKPFEMQLQLRNAAGCRQLISAVEKWVTDSFPNCVLAKFALNEMKAVFYMGFLQYDSLKMVCQKTTAILPEMLSSSFSEFDSAQVQRAGINNLQMLAIALIQSGSLYELGNVIKEFDTRQKAGAFEKGDFYEAFLLVKSLYYASFQDYVKANDCLRLVLIEIQDQKNPNNVLLKIIADNFFALYSHEEKKYEKAVAYCDSGINLLSIQKAQLSVFSNQLMYLPLYSNKVLSLLKLNRLGEADSLSLLTLKYLDLIPGNSSLFKSKILQNRGGVLLKQRRFAEAAAIADSANEFMLQRLFTYFNSITEAQKIELLGSLESYFNSLPLHLQIAGSQEADILAKKNYNQALLFKGIILRSRQLTNLQVRNENDTAAASILRQLNDAEASIAMLQQNNIPAGEKLRKKKSDLEEALNRRSATFRNLQSELAVTWRQVLDSLKPAQTAVEFIEYDEMDLQNNEWTNTKRYAALILTGGDTVVHYVPLCTGADVARLIVKTKSKNTNQLQLHLLCSMSQTAIPPQKQLRLSDSLYQYIWAPLKSFIKKNNTVFIAPAGLLSQVPFQCLPGITPGLLLQDDYEIRIVTTTGTVTRPAAMMGQLPATASFWYNISYGAAALQPQPVNEWLGTLKKFYTKPLWSDTATRTRLVDEIIPHFKKLGIQTTAHKGTAATESAFKKIKRESAGILHIATHGFSVPMFRMEKLNVIGDFNIWQNRHPLFYSGLVMAGANEVWTGGILPDAAENGLLTAYEAAQMDLSNTELVVLEACETGLGYTHNTEGMMGLARGFKLAGAKKVIASLWPVTNQPSAELLNLFYKYWLTEKMPVSNAFNKARVILSRKYPLPYFWAGFVLIE